MSIHIRTIWDDEGERLDRQTVADKIGSAHSDGLARLIVNDYGNDASLAMVASEDDDDLPRMVAWCDRVARVGDRYEIDLGVNTNALHAVTLTPNPRLTAYSFAFAVLHWRENTLPQTVVVSFDGPISATGSLQDCGDGGTRTFDLTDESGMMDAIEFITQALMPSQLVISAHDIREAIREQLRDNGLNTAEVDAVMRAVSISPAVQIP